MLDGQLVAYVTFEPDNTLRCFQDFRTFRGAPSGVRFEVYEVAGKGERPRHKLIAPGYGKTGNYGDGAIFVYDLDLGQAEPAIS